MFISPRLFVSTFMEHFYSYHSLLLKVDSNYWLSVPTAIPIYNFTAYKFSHVDTPNSNRRYRLFIFPKHVLG